MADDAEALCAAEAARVEADRQARDEAFSRFDRVLQLAADEFRAGASKIRPKQPRFLVQETVARKFGYLTYRIEISRHSTVAAVVRVKKFRNGTFGWEAPADVADLPYESEARVALTAYLSKLEPLPPKDPRAVFLGVIGGVALLVGLTFAWKVVLGLLLIVFSRG